MKAFFIGGLLFCSVFLVDCSNPDRPYAKLEPSQTRKIRVHFQTAPNTCGPAALIGDQHIAITDPIWDSTVIEPYSAHTAGDKDKPAVYTRNSTPTVKGKVWCENNLSQSTPIHLDTLGPHSMDFDADGGSIQNGISAYFTLPSSNGGNDQFKNFVYKYGPSVGYGTPSHSKYLLQWKYRIDGDDVWMDTMNDTDHVIYLTLSTPTGYESVPSDKVLNFACGWAENKTTEDSVCVDILNNGFKEHYEYYDGGPCAFFSSDFCRLVESLGITCTLHEWAVAARYIEGNMILQKSNPLPTVGHLTPKVYERWGFHQWCEANNKIRDPSTGKTYTGDWGNHEDRVFDEYKRCTVSGTAEGDWDENISGQSSGCEVTARYSNPLPLPWLGPGVNPF